MEENENLNARLSAATQAILQQKPWVFVVHRSKNLIAEMLDLLMKRKISMGIAADGQTVLQLLKSCKKEHLPDIIFIDDRFDGYDTVRHIKSDQNLQDIVIVMMIYKIPNRTKEAYTAKALEAGADFFLIKPIKDSLILKNCLEAAWHVSVAKKIASLYRTVDKT